MRQIAKVETLQERDLVGKKVGKHRIPEGRTDAKMGEELIENLHGLKVSVRSSTWKIGC